MQPSFSFNQLVSLLQIVNHLLQQLERNTVFFDPTAQWSDCRMMIQQSWHEMEKQKNRKDPANSFWTPLCAVEKHYLNTCLADRKERQFLHPLSSCFVKTNCTRPSIMLRMRENICEFWMLHHLTQDNINSGECCFSIKMTKKNYLDCRMALVMITWMHWWCGRCYWRVWLEELHCGASGSCVMELRASFFWKQSQANAFESAIVFAIVALQGRHGLSNYGIKGDSLSKTGFRFS